MEEEEGGGLTVLRRLVEEDIQKQMGRPIHNRHLWKCLILDFLLVQVVIGPFTVAIWRGAWELYDELFLNLLGDDRMLVGSVCFISGFLVSVLVAVFYRDIDFLAKKAGRKRYFLVTRIFSVARFLTTLLYWKGMFDMLDSFSEWFVAQFSVTLAACILFILGSFKSAAITPPLGVDLDTQDDYINVSTVYRTVATDPFCFRFLDGLCTTIIEVISVIAFYGAWGTGKWYFGARTEDEYLTLHNGGIALAQAHIASLVVFLSQFVYLHNHFRCHTQCYVNECKNLFYAMILILSLFATSSYIRGWWEILDMLAAHTFPRAPVLENILCFFAGFVVVITMGTASYNHSGVSRETTRERDGILLPFFYLTYYLRDRAGEDGAAVKWRTHDPIFGRCLAALGLAGFFSSGGGETDPEAAGAV
jgi:hypothetical protein